MRASPIFFGAEGYDNVQGLRQSGFESVPGWHQWCWSSNPKRGSQNWRRKKRGCIHVTRKLFFRDLQLVRVRLQVKEGDPRLSIIGLDWTFRPSE